MNLLRRAVAVLVIGALHTLTSRPVQACLWDDEVYEAEERAMPCLTSAVVGSFPRHTPSYYQARLSAAESVLAADPFNTWALDLAGVALLKQGKLKESEAMMLRRQEAQPDAYATHANLGTLYTFSGDFDAALTHIDRAMAVEPKAHFGREKYHRLLVVYLKALKAQPARATENFLGVTVTDAERSSGSPQKFDAAMQKAGLGRDAFDALVAMITVYGASDNPHVLAGAGDMLALFGSIGYAGVAYTRAAKLKHPAAAEMNRRAKLLLGKLAERTPKRPKDEGQDPQFHSMDELLYLAEHPEADPAKPSPRALFAAFEEREIKKGLAVWTKDGLSRLYQEQDRLAPRCPVGASFRELSEPGATLAADAGAK
jgi:tetratricopeptide (TPR) repeat protein